MVPVNRVATPTNKNKKKPKTNTNTNTTTNKQRNPLYSSSEIKTHHTHLHCESLPPWSPPIATITTIRTHNPQHHHNQIVSNPQHTHKWGWDRDHRWGWDKKRNLSLREREGDDGSEIEKWWTKCVGLSVWSCFDTNLVSLQKSPLWSCLFSFFCYFLFFFLEERDIKWKVIYIFTLDFNRGGLRNPNEVKHTWANC